MKKHLVSLIAFTALVAVTLAAYAQPDGEKEKGKKGPPDGKKGFILGKILPPFIRDRLDLTEAQNDKIDALEKDVKAKLEKILTAEQIRIAQEPMDKKGGKGDKKGDKGGKGDKKWDKGGKGDKKGDKGGKGPPDRPDMEEARANPVSGIQWYATWDSGRREAQRTNRPILLVSAAPHCAGVSGTW